MDQKSNTVDAILEKSEGLSKSLNARQIVMFGVAGTIGTGLFLGSGYVLESAGPGGTIMAYLLSGIVMWMMMMCLGELSSAMPVAGSIQAYATEYINPPLGFTVGWVNWIACATTITAQIVASAIIMKNIIPSVSTTIWLVVFIVLILGANLLNTSKYGELSFWFGSLKLILIVAFIIIGVGMIFGVVGSEAIGFSNYTSNGGFFPKGGAVIIVAMLTTIYSYGGSELFANAAGEIKNKKDVPKAVHATTWILIGSYMLSIVVLVAIFPWTNAGLLSSPFAAALNIAGINGAELIINIIILTSALSSGNYFTNACMRYMWSMAKYNQAPKIFAKVTKKQVPIYALLLSMAFAAFSMVASFIAEDTVYLFLMTIIAGSNIFLYSVTCICQMRFRKRFLAEGGDLNTLNYKTPLYPFVPILGVAMYALVLVFTLFDESQRLSVIICFIMYGVIYVASHFFLKKRGNKIVNIKMDD
jgi:arginine/ornithine permease